MNEEARMLNTFAQRLFGNKPCTPEEGEHIDEELDSLLDNKNKSKLGRRKKKNRIKKKRS